VTPADLLAGLVRALEDIQAVAAKGRRNYDTDRLTRLAIQRLWISAGNYAEEYRRHMNLGAGDEPWSELYGYRSVLAHSLDEELIDNRIWEETVEDLPRLLAQVRRHRSKPPA
jgi:uncharacterized protein with HEPN domain